MSLGPDPVILWEITVADSIIIGRACEVTAGLGAISAFLIYIFPNGLCQSRVGRVLRFPQPLTI